MFEEVVAAGGDEWTRLPSGGSELMAASSGEWTRLPSNASGVFATRSGEWALPLSSTSKFETASAGCFTSCAAAASASLQYLDDPDPLDWIERPKPDIHDCPPSCTSCPTNQTPKDGDGGDSSCFVSLGDRADLRARSRTTGSVIGSKWVVQEVCAAYWRAALCRGGSLDRRAKRVELALQHSSPSSAWFTRRLSPPPPLSHSTSFIFWCSR